MNNFINDCKGQAMQESYSGQIAVPDIKTLCNSKKRGIQIGIQVYLSTCTYVHPFYTPARTLTCIYAMCRCIITRTVQ